MPSVRAAPLACCFNDGRVSPPTFSELLPPSACGRHALHPSCDLRCRAGILCCTACCSPARMHVPAVLDGQATRVFFHHSAAAEPPAWRPAPCPSERATSSWLARSAAPQPLTRAPAPARFTAPGVAGGCHMHGGRPWGEGRGKPCPAAPTAPAQRPSGSQRPLGARHATSISPPRGLMRSIPGQSPTSTAAWCLRCRSFRAPRAAPRSPGRRWLGRWLVRGLGWWLGRWGPPRAGHSHCGPGSTALPRPAECAPHVLQTSRIAPAEVGLATARHSTADAPPARAGVCCLPPPPARPPSCWFPGSPQP